MGNQEFRALLQRYHSGTTTDDERALVEAWYMQLQLAEAEKLTDEQLDSILGMQVPVVAEPQRRTLWKRVAVAATLFIITSLGIYFALNQHIGQQPDIAQVSADIRPGGNKAVLTLATGQKIILNDAKTGVLGNEAEVTIRKTADGKIAYSTTDNNEASAIRYNTMATPRGGQYQLTLADGTKVWLNAASSITYPTRFVGRERKVEITGEAYFEVAHLSGQPFHVVSAGQEVEVLGTHFNVNAYADEQMMKTTLLEGSVKVYNLGTHSSNLLRPGEQAQVSAAGTKVAAADIEQAMAWREGKFRFGENSDIRTVMSEISRWYDIDVEYRGTVNRHFGGSISRQVAIAKVLTLLQSTGGVKFNVSPGDASGKGRRVIVMP